MLGLGLVFSGISALVSSVTAVLPTLFQAIGMGVVLSQVVGTIFKGLGQIKEDEEIDDLGDRAIQAEQEGITPEQYDHYGDYVKAVKEFQCDPEKSAAIDKQEKWEKGVEVLSCSWVERFGTGILDVFKCISEHPALAEYFNVNRLPLLSEVNKGDSDTFADVARYLQGQETDMEKADQTLEKMYDVEKKIDPDISFNDFMKTIEQLRD